MESFGRIQPCKTRAGAQRYEVDLRKEVHRLKLGLPEKVGRICSVPSLTGREPIETLSRAQSVLAHIRGKVAEGVPLVTVLESFRPTGASHVLACAERFVERQREQADAGEITHRSVDLLEGQIRNHWAPKWTGVSVYEVSAAHLDDWARELRKSLGPGTTTVVLAGMRSMMHWMRRRKELSAVPDFPSVKIPENDPRLLSREQQDAVLEAIPVERRGIFLSMADLMLRPSEARALRPAVYELVKDRTEGDPVGWMTIKCAAVGEGSNAVVREWTKTRKIRTLPVSDRLADWIAEHVPADARITQEFLFPAPRGGMISHSTLRTTWNRACRDAGVREVPVREGTRHSSATAARRAEIPLDLIRLFLGHTNQKTTERYSKSHNDALVALVRRGK
jgi:integrase